MGDDNFKYTDDFFREFEEKYMSKSRPEVKKIKPQRKKNKFKLIIPIISVLSAALLIILLIPKGEQPKPEVSDTNQTNATENVVEALNPYKDLTEFSVVLAEEINSEFAVIINSDTGEILAQKNYQNKMYPASLTKIMTLLVALDNIENLTDTYEMSYRIIDPPYRQGASMAGFSSGEKVRIIDLLYGIILPSGADATCGIADYVSGSEKEFVVLMNKKCEELGLLNTHFANSSGLFDEQNYTTAYDMAIILREALKNDIARQILSKSDYTTSATPQHPDGIYMDSTLSHYIRGNETDNNTKILGGKTGFVSESGNCIASFAVSQSGNNYIMVTGKAESGKKAAKDHISVYSLYAN